MRAPGQCHHRHCGIMVGTRAASRWAPGQCHTGHWGSVMVGTRVVQICRCLTNPGCTGWHDRARGSVARHGAPAVPRLAAPGTRRCPCVRLCQAPHACLRLVLCAHHAPVPASGTPCPGSHSARCRGHAWQWGQRAVLCRAVRLQESQACTAAGQPEQGGCHGPDIRAAHPVPQGPCMVPPPHTCGVWAVPWRRTAEPGFVFSCGSWLIEATAPRTAGGCRAGDLSRH